MLLAAGVEGFSHGPWVTFNIPHMQTSGFSLQTATTIVGIYGLIQVVLRYSIGVLSDRIGRRRIYISSYLFQTVGIISFAFLSPERIWLAPIYLITQGISHAAIVIGRDSIVADYFGTKRYSTIRGLRQALVLPATFLAPLFMGTLFDLQGNYRLGYIIVAIIGATGSIWLSLIRRPQWENFRQES
jgi:MFS family permease